MHKDEGNPFRQLMNARARVMDRLFLQIAHDAVHDFLNDERDREQERASLEAQWERS